jgi:hypothetical protein
MSYIGSTPTTQSFISGTDYFNGNGSTTAFTLSRTVASVNDIQAVVNNVVQVPNDAYNISGTTITFTSAPSSGTGNVYVRYMSTTTQSITPSQNTVSYSSLNTSMQGTFGGSFKNRIINGAMVIWQRGTAAVTINSDNFTYTVDRFFSTGQSTDGVYTVQQSSNAPAGFDNSILATVTTADASVGTAQYYYIAQSIEGYNIADFDWGTVNAQTVTLSFWVRSSLTGTFGGSIRNDSANRSYPFSYTIGAANTWEQKFVTIPGETTGSWVNDSGRGMIVNWSLGTGTSRQNTAGAWASGNFDGVTGQTQVIGTSGATFYITGVQLEKGSTATSFDYRPYGTELQLCQRYCEVLKNSGVTNFAQIAVGQCEASTSGTVGYFYQTAKRAAPTVTYDTANKYSVTGSGGSAITLSSISTARADTTSLAIGFGVASGLTGGNATRLLDNNTNNPITIISSEL